VPLPPLAPVHQSSHALSPVASHHVLKGVAVELEGANIRKVVLFENVPAAKWQNLHKRRRFFFCTCIELNRLQNQNDAKYLSARRSRTEWEEIATKVERR
jgi:hypothetical protein